MKPTRLYLKDFMCYDWAYIDFTQFSAALIMGKSDGNLDEPNGIGKTTLFKAIEYVLFNQSTFNLERIVRDDAASCQVTLDFVIGQQEYRLARKRTRKGVADLSLYERTAEDGTETQAWHTEAYEVITDKKYWKDISGRRAVDTEKDVAKLLKINFKAFRTFVHFVQHDFTSLATATPEKRKTILKDVLNLAVYAKLEKMAKDKATALTRELDRCRLLVDNLGDPDTELDKLQIQLITAEDHLTHHRDHLQQLQSELQQSTDKITQLTSEYSALENKFSSSILKEQNALQAKTRTEVSVKEYRTKKTIVIQEARDLVVEVKQLEEKQTELAGINYSDLDVLNEKIEHNKVLITQHDVNIKSATQEYQDLQIPMPVGSVCKHCRQPMSEQHRQECVSKDRQRIIVLQTSIKNSKSIIVKANVENQNYQQSVNQLLAAKQSLEGITNKIAAKKKEITDKRARHDEYVTVLDKLTAEVKEKDDELAQIKIELANSSLEEAKVIHKRIEQEKQHTAKLAGVLSLCNKEITHHNSSKAVIVHNMDTKKQDRQKKHDLSKVIKELESKLFMYPHVIRGFSSIGIPNLIIHNILDDLQAKTNLLLEQFKPGLQCFFSIEKAKDDGVEDTLDINYQVNGKDRYYEQLGGAQKLMVLFSLKLGLYFLLKDELGIDIQFLLLDEIDQPLGKGRVDAFADIIKILQKDFTILVITHNDRLKDKFSHTILVEQERDVSCARVVSSSW